MQSMNMQEKYP